MIFTERTRWRLFAGVVLAFGLVACSSSKATGGLVAPVSFETAVAVPATSDALPTSWVSRLPFVAEPAGSPTAGATPTYGYTVVHSYPHDRAAFTEGLQVYDGWLYEGTGLVGQSVVRKVRLETGEVVQEQQLKSPYFGEGITILHDKVYQLTWQSHIGFVYRLQDFNQVDSFTYASEGWGLTNDGQRIIMSDGTATLRFLDPQTMQETGRLEVRDQGVPVTQLNELEWVRGEIFANVWLSDRIARIDAHSGKVVGWIDLHGLLGSVDRKEAVDVLNGIAYDAATDRLFVTGKLWPKLFEIRLVPTP
ncbi:MAG: glutaminyl-peptide cyclotransferase [Herpetosiphon sp.]